MNFSTESWFAFCKQWQLLVNRKIMRDLLFHIFFLILCIKFKFNAFQRVIYALISLNKKISNEFDSNSTIKIVRYFLGCFNKNNNDDLVYLERCDFIRLSAIWKKHKSIPIQNNSNKISDSCIECPKRTQ